MVLVIDEGERLRAVPCILENLAKNVVGEVDAEAAEKLNSEEAERMDAVYGRAGHFNKYTKPYKPLR